MNKIIQLDQETINHIAAGEVVDRPASVVKELIENSIDSGADRISIEIENGGISLIRITDNGSGFEKDDIRLAFKRHSTSKIKNALDLMCVSSLGFRGEALSSIAAVSQVDLITKTEGEYLGVRYRIEGGVEKSFEEVGTATGTTIVARNLFFNTPARRKFLKTAQTEGGYIYSVVEHMALSHPEIAFSLSADNKPKLSTTGRGNLKEVIYSIYGKEVYDNLLEIDYESELVSIKGYIGRSYISKGNRSNETYFVNGRYIHNDLITKAIEDGYRNILMQHKYPFTVLNFQVEQELIDVNVHPSKMEIRFREADRIYPIIAMEVAKALVTNTGVTNVTIGKPAADSKKSAPKHKALEPFEHKNSEPFKEEIKPENVQSANKTAENVNNKAEISYDTSQNDNNRKDNVLKESFKAFDDFIEQKDEPSFKLIGQVFETYWIIEYEKRMLIVDQHAAHEKVMFEKFMKRLSEKEKNTQLIVPPRIVTLSNIEAELLEKYMNEFTEFGFEIEPFGGNEYAIRGIPLELYTLDAAEVFSDIMDNLSLERGKLKSDIVVDRIATMSCKAAIKGNMRISEREAKELISQMLKLDNPFNCPHGRPTVISLTKYEIEKKFKRIV